jgi:hypothetical protein
MRIPAPDRVMLPPRTNYLVIISRSPWGQNSSMSWVSFVARAFLGRSKLEALGLQLTQLPATPTTPAKTFLGKPILVGI